MKKVIKLTESNLHKVIKRLVNEQEDIFDEDSEGKWLKDRFGE